MRTSNQFIVGAFFAMALIGLFAINVSAAPPANDDFANAQLISGINGQVNGANTGATKQANEPDHAWNRGGKSVWFKYIAPGNGFMTINTAGSEFNTLLAVYQGTTLNDLKFVAANNDVENYSNASPSSQLVFGTATNNIYLIAVDGVAGANGIAASGNLTLNFQLTDAPVNDNFAVNSNYRELSPNPHVKFVTASNIGAGKEVGEPNHAGNPGGKSIWFTFPAMFHPLSITFELVAKNIGNPDQGIDSLLSVYRGSQLNSLTPLASTVIPAGHTGRLTVDFEANDVYYVAIDGYNAGAGAASGNFLLAYGSTKSRKHPDRDGDGIPDISVFRPLTGAWYTLDSIRGDLQSFNWGTIGDKPQPNYWDDDNRPDYAVFRPDTQIWHVERSSNNSYTPFPWGINTDIPLTFNQFSQGANYCYATVFRQATGTWWIDANSGPIGFAFGQNGDIPLTADFDGDGTDEVAVFRPANGTWYIGNPFTGALIRSVQFGQNGDKPVPADYDGDGKTDIAVYRPSTGAWYILQSKNGAFLSVGFGLSTDIPQPADYTGDGLDDVAVFRPSTGTWWILDSANNGVKGIQFGSNGDIPVSAPIY